MGLSVAISGGIMIVAFVMVMMMLPSIVNNIFSIQQVSSSISEDNQMISNTDISVRYLETQIGSSLVNFTLYNQGSQSLWKFDSFNLYVEYFGTGSGKRTIELMYSGQCMGGIPPIKHWCIEGITNDFKDPNILNLGEGARVRTNLSQNLANTDVVVTVVTDKGIINTSGFDFTEVTTLETLTNVTDTGCALNQVIKVNSTGFWACANDENTGGITTMESLTNVTDTGCADGQVRKASAGQWICADDVGAGGIITSINGDSTAAQVFSGVPGNLTITDTGAGTLTFNTGYNVVMTQGSAQTVTKGLTLNALTLGGTMNGAGNTISGVGVLSSSSADPADSGMIRLGNGEFIAWEQSPASTDLTITADSSENFVWDTLWNNINFGSNPFINAIFDVAGTGNRLTSTGTALGDILKSDGTDFKRLARGSANQVLKVNAAGTDIAWSSYGIPVSLTSDVTCSVTASYCTAFTIPLTPSTSNVIKATIIGETNTGGAALQFRGRADDAQATGTCHITTATTATAVNDDAIAVGTAPADTGTTAWAAGANISMPVFITCTVQTDASSPQNLIIEWQQEVASTGTVRTNSHYIILP